MLFRSVAALLAGGALAVAGVGFQGLTRNPLAEPSVLGVSSGAAFGVVLAQVFGLRTGLLEALGLTAFAFAGAFVAGSAVYVIAASAGGLPVHTLVLAGVIVGIFFSSAITVLISIVDFDRLGGVIHWLLGNLAPLPLPALGVFGLVAALGFWLVLGQSRQLNLLALGEEGALQLGVDAERVKRQGLAGAATAHGFSGRLRRADRLRGLISARSARMTLGRTARAHGLPRRGTLPPRRRHARPDPHRAGGAAGGRDHLVLRRPVLRLSPALALRSDRAVTPLVELREVEFAYPAGGPVPRRPFAIRALSATVEDGEIFGVIGPNASGKTTLIRLLSRVLVPVRGEILIAGRPLGALARADVARDIAVSAAGRPQGFPYTWRAGADGPLSAFAEAALREAVMIRSTPGRPWPPPACSTSGASGSTA